MASKYAFEEKKSQYEKYFRKWGFKKNQKLTESEAAFTGRRVAKRKQLFDNESELYKDGVGWQPPPTRHETSGFAWFRQFKRGSQQPATAAPERSGPVGEIWKIWWPETLSVLLGFFSFVIIVVVLDKFDDQNLPDWPYNISLNTFLSIASTFARAAFMFPVSVAIGQAQWTWFLKARPLHDFHLLDQASRSPWGSLALLWRAPVFRHPVALGALLTVIGVLTSPVTLLAITYPVRDTPDPSAVANAPSLRSIRYPEDDLDKGMRMALPLGPVSDTTNFTLPSEPPSGAPCSTGNCTFVPYHSLGVCVRTANITSRLTVAEYDDKAQWGDKPIMADFDDDFVIPGAKVYAASLPGGPELTQQGALGVHIDILNGNNSFGFSSRNEEDAGPLSARIASFVSLYTVPLAINETWASGGGDIEEILAGISSFRHEALEALFYLCVQTYKTSIANGVEKNELVSQVARPADNQLATAELPFLDLNCTAFMSDESRMCYAEPFRRDDVLYLETSAESDGSPEKDGDTSSREREDFSANYYAMERMATSMRKLLTGYAINAYDPQLFPNATYTSEGAPFLSTVFEDVLYSLDSSTNATNVEYYQTRLTNVFVNIATAVSSMMRIGEPRRYTQDVFNATGEAWREISYVHIPWGWLAFLAGELVLATALIALTVVGKHEGGVAKESRSVPPGLKDSSLAVLSALGPECRELMGGGIRPIQELKARSRELSVTLKGGEIVPAERVKMVAPFRGSSSRSQV